MALKDYEVAQSTVDLPGGVSFTVRGISFYDLTVLLKDHSEDMNRLFLKYTQSGELSPEEVQAAIPSALAESPRLVAATIALAADEPDMQDKVLKLPFNVQLEAVEQIFINTFTTEAALKKLIELVTRVLLALSTTMSTLAPTVRQTVSALGSGSSADT